MSSQEDHARIRRRKKENDSQPLSVTPYQTANYMTKRITLDYAPWLTDLTEDMSEKSPIGEAKEKLGNSNRDEQEKETSETANRETRDRAS